MSADNVRKIRFAPLPASFALNAAVQFAIQAWLAYSFAAHVWRLPGPLPWFAPAALDAFVVNMMIVAYELRGARLRTRAYVWGVLALGIGAQIGAAEGYASFASWGLAARVASFAPALLLAASLHTLIIRRKHVDPPKDGQGHEAKPDTASEPAPSATAEPEPVAAPAVVPSPTATVQAAINAASANRAARRPRRGGDDEAVALVRKLVTNGTSCAVAATQVGRSKRWAEKHTADIRAARDAQPVTTDDVEIHEAASGPGAASLSKGDGPDDLASATEIQGDMPLDDQLQER